MITFFSVPVFLGTTCSFSASLFVARNIYIVADVAAVVSAVVAVTGVATRSIVSAATVSVAVSIVSVQR